MKKLSAVLISALLLISMMLCVSAEDYQFSTWVDWEAGKHIVFALGDEDSYESGSLFHWGMTANMSCADGLLKVNFVSDDPVAARQMLSITPHNVHWGLDTGVYPVIAVTYKSEGDFNFIFLQDTDDTYDFPQQAVVKCAASTELTTVYYEIPAELRTNAVLSLLRFDVYNPNSDVYLRDFGVFTSIEEAQAYYNPAPDNGGDAGDDDEGTEPSPDTFDPFTVVLVVTASAGAVLTLTKKKR